MEATIKVADITLDLKNLQYECYNEFSGRPCDDEEFEAQRGSKYPNFATEIQFMLSKVPESVQDCLVLEFLEMDKVYPWFFCFEDLAKLKEF